MASICSDSDMQTPASVLSSPPQLLSTLEELFVEVDAQLSTVEGLLGPDDAMVSHPLTIT